MGQCFGVTKSNERCKNKVTDGQYCHYHKNQSLKNSSKTKGSSKIELKSSSARIENDNNKHGNHNRNQRPVYKIILPKAPSSLQSTVPARKKNTDTGSIYMYTLSHLLTDHQKRYNFLNIRALDQDQSLENSNASKLALQKAFFSALSAKNVDGSSHGNLKSSSPELVPFDSKHFILVKIGLTTQPVTKRIQQWQKQCNHDITLVSPDILKQASPSSLSSLFSKLNIDDPYYSKNKLSFNPKGFLTNLGGRNKISEGNFRCFNHHDNSFYCQNNLREIERKIHSQLRYEFGTVEMECVNCSLNNSKRNTPKGKDTMESNKVIHREWFVIPKVSLIEVFLKIDFICHHMGKQTLAK
ncbi:hypothetical protein DASC09_027710 [Saccharomycopsis crataegensis]|uniref:Bacteriophage T5 Orf172 DNA-binding domain-containing protein n=1 Tax=Saccharomycopsis crataegensis TaxID=43959 RepID=A0AAV5QLJ3_9ASCO|nr:hypothetical protein DASC09_027710 [Saccharomycopsis crataegensis]